MAAISAVIIALDEASRIADAVKSAHWADEVLVVDGGSRDETREIARQAGARVIENPWPGFSTQKNFGASQAHHDWILSLDADERIDESLARSVRALGEGIDRAAGYEVARRPIFYGRLLRFGGYYPGYRVRLYDRRRGRWNGRLVHERVTLEGARGRLEGDLLHYTGHGLRDDYRRMLQFTELAAREASAAGRRRGFFSLFARPPAAFVWRYFLRLGFLDGTPGLIAATQSSLYAYLKYGRAWEASVRARSAAASNRQGTARER
ncbi:MAG: glycosyltransferase family 2 protein [Acidobacteriota bacterium]